MRYAYNIGEHTFSLYDIEHGILRGAMSKPIVKGGVTTLVHSLSLSFVLLVVPFVPLIVSLQTDDITNSLRDVQRRIRPMFSWVMRKDAIRVNSNMHWIGRF